MTIPTSEVLDTIMAAAVFTSAGMIPLDPEPQTWSQIRISSLCLHVTRAVVMVSGANLWPVLTFCWWNWAHIEDCSPLPIAGHPPPHCAGSHFLLLHWANSHQHLLLGWKLNWMKVSSPQVLYRINCAVMFKNLRPNWWKWIVAGFIIYSVFWLNLWTNKC